MWAADDGRERDSSEWESLRQQRAAKQERRLVAETERHAQSLSADERDRNIRRIHAQVGLSTRHRQNLRDRGLSDTQIDTGKFFSTAPRQEVTGINPRLAGVDRHGRKLLSKKSGYGCPIWNVQGRIIGYQVRVDNPTSGDKYIWPASQYDRPSGSSSHLPNAELPITCCRPLDGVKLNSIGLAEGILKSWITAQKRGQIVIGAAGGNWVSSPQQLITYIDELAAQLNTKTLTLYPDKGAIANNGVMKRYQRVIEMVRERGYSVQVAWWGQETKQQPDIDELDSFDSIIYLTPEEFFNLGKHSHQTAHGFTGLFGILPRLKRLFEKQQRSPWGFGRKDEVEVEPSPAAPETLKYAPGERNDVLQAAYHLGYQHVLDISPTGTGKSFDVGLLTPEMFDARQIIYVSKEHRNPTTPTLKGWSDLEARHKGLYRDEFDRLRRVNQGQPYVIAPNCGRNETIAALRAKNIHGADTASLICKTCPNYEPCQAGAVYGFLGERRVALQQPRVRAHPDSLPSPGEYDYNHVVLVWDEAGEALKAHRSTEVRTADVDQAMGILLRKRPEAFDALRPLLTTLDQYLSREIKQPNKYGWGNAQIRQVLPLVGDIDLDAVRAALTPDARHILDTTQEHGVDAADLPRQIRKKFTPTDQSTAERISHELALDWLPDLLDVLLGNQIGSLRIQYGVLTMTLGNQRSAEIARAASCNIYLDATASPEDITRRLRLEDSKQLLVTQQTTQTANNLEVIQVQMGQRLGISSRRKDDKGDDTFLQKRIDALIDQIQVENPSSKVAVSEFKRHTKLGDGKRHHWVDTRGVNDLEDYDVLVLIGIMCRSLAALEAEFTILYGRPPKEGTERIKYPIQVNGNASTDQQHYFETDESADPEFRAFVRRSILADTRQAIGRLRAHRRPNKKLKVYILGDYAFDFPVSLVQAGDLSPNAATKKERKLTALVSAAKEFLANGQKVTQKAVAEVVGCSQQLVSRYWQLLQTLLDDSNSKSGKTSQAPPNPDEIDWSSQEYVPLLAQESPDEVLKGILAMFEAHGQAAFRAIWDATPATSQINILKTLFLSLPTGDLHLLAQLVKT